MKEKARKEVGSAGREKELVNRGNRGPAIPTR
jgi:hypothetical protein